MGVLDDDEDGHNGDVFSENFYISHGPLIAMFYRVYRNHDHRHSFDFVADVSRKGVADDPYVCVSLQSYLVVSTLVASKIRFFGYSVSFHFQTFWLLHHHETICARSLLLPKISFEGHCCLKYPPSLSYGITAPRFVGDDDPKLIGCYHIRSIGDWCNHRLGEGRSTTIGDGVGASACRGVGSFHRCELGDHQRYEAVAFRACNDEVNLGDIRGACAHFKGPCLGGGVVAGTLVDKNDHLGEDCLLLSFAASAAT